jgi:hypothetical protein
MKNRDLTLKSPLVAQYPHETIAARAKLLWERRGRPAGRDDEFWHEAERHLRTPSLAQADDARFADPGALLNRDGAPNDDLDNRLNEIANPAERRSATAL